MKQFLFITIAICSFIVANAQSTIGSFSNQYAQKDLNVSVLLKDNKLYRVEIECPIKGAGRGYIWLKPGDVNKFRTALIEMQGKFNEWKETAIANSVDEYRKELPAKFPKVTFCWTVKDSYFATNSPVKFTFVRTKGKTFALMTYKATDDGNKYIDETFRFVFYSSEEIQSLIDLLDQSKIDAAAGNPVDDSLFN
jgi:hypothetical protein